MTTAARRKLADTVEGMQRLRKKQDITILCVILIELADGGKVEVAG